VSTARVLAVGSRPARCSSPCSSPPAPAACSRTGSAEEDRLLVLKRHVGIPRPSGDQAGDMMGSGEIRSTGRSPVRVRDAQLVTRALLDDVGDPGAEHAALPGQLLETKSAIL